MGWRITLQVPGGDNRRMNGRMEKSWALKNAYKGFVSPVGDDGWLTVCSLGARGPVSGCQSKGMTRSK